jgi:arylformamidase
MEFFDLTLPLRPNMAVWPGDPAVTFTRARSHETDGYQVTEFSLGSHSGTHLDAPRHFFPDGATLDQYPMDRLVGEGLVVDCRCPDQIADHRPARSTAVPSVKAGAAAGSGEANGPGIIDSVLLAQRLQPFLVPSGGFLLLWTEGALLTVEAAYMLLETGPSLVGTDSFSLDAEPHPVHRLLLGHGILLAERLRGLDRLGSGCVTCVFLPLAVAEADGAPVRAIAWR